MGNNIYRNNLKRRFNIQKMLRLPVIFFSHVMSLIILFLMISMSCHAKAVFPGKVIAESTDPLNLLVGSPAIAVLPDGTYVASHDWSGDKINGTYTSIYVSADKGQNWQLASTVKDLRWGGLFVLNGSLYLMGVKAAYGDISIRKSTDAAKTWSIATDATSGILFKGRYHTGPVPVVVHNGRVWRAYEESPDTIQPRNFKAFVISAPENSDLLNASNWTKSTAIDFNTDWINGIAPGWLEGNVVVSPEGNVIDYLRVDTEQEPNGNFGLDCPVDALTRYKVAAKINISADGRTATFAPANDFINFPGAFSKFTIRYDPVSGKYWSIANRITNTDYPYAGASNSPRNQRNVLVLYSSSDLVNWEEKYILFRWNEGKIITRRENFGFQYADWQMDGNDIVAVVRTSWYGSDWHDSNMLTFSKIENFRNVNISSSPADLNSLTNNVTPLLQWQFTSPVFTGKEESANSTFTNPNLNVSVLTRGAGLTNSLSYVRTFSAATVTANVEDNSKANAVLNNQYFQFNVQARNGFSVSLSTIDAKFSRNSEGPTSYRWSYSLDGVNFTEISSGDVFDFTDPDGNGQVQSTVRLDSYPELQKVSSDGQVVFRVYFWRATLSSGRISFGRYSDLTPSLSVGGTVDVTEPAENPVLAWNFSGITGVVSGATPPSYTADQSEGSALSRGTGLVPASLNNAYYSFFPSGASPANGKSNAIAGNDYYSFTVKAKSGYNLTLTKIKARLRRNSTGPVSYRWMYSLDGINFKEAGDRDVMLLDNTDSGVSQPPVDLSGIAELRNVNASKTITFRLYAWGANSATGGLAFGRYTGNDCLSLTGSLQKDEKVLNAWQFYNDNGMISTGKEDTYTSTTTDESVAESILTRGQGAAITSSGHVGGFIAYFTPSISKQTAVANNCYFEFRMKPKPGNEMSLSSLDARLRRQEFSAYNYRWMYSQNGNDFTEIGSEDCTISDFAVNNGYVQPTINLSGYSDLQMVTENKTVTFRLYAWGGTETTTTQKHFGFGQSKIATGPALKVSGSAQAATSTAIPEDNKNRIFIHYSLSTGLKVDYENNSNSTCGIFEIKDTMGKLLYSDKISLQQGSNIVYLPCVLNNGVYIFTINSDNIAKSIKFTNQ